VLIRPPSPAPLLPAAACKCDGAAGSRAGHAPNRAPGLLPRYAAGQARRATSARQGTQRSRSGRGEEVLQIQDAPAEIGRAMQQELRIYRRHHAPREESITRSAMSTVRPWPRWWRITVVALATLIL